jgi:nicotinamide riboside transporter PnuC
MEYYLLDWAAMFTAFLSVYMLGNHNRWGFLVFMVSNVFWVAVGFLAASDAMIYGNIVFFAVNLRGLLKWNREAKSASPDQRPSG